ATKCGRGAVTHPGRVGDRPGPRVVRSCAMTESITAEPLTMAGEPSRPCLHCGRPVPQRASAGRPFRYCRDNDGQGQRASRNVRLRQRNAPGLDGQVARAYEVVDRLDQVAAALTAALDAELSPAGVERQLAQVRAEAATQVAAAHEARDDARTEAETAR